MFDDQNIVITQNVRLVPKKVSKSAKLGVTSRPKSVSRKYLINGNVVCKELFLTTYAITNGRLQRLLEKVQKNPNAAPKDGRGKHKKQKTINKDVYNILVAMIESLPKYTSHYHREKNNDNVVFLQPETVLTYPKEKKMS